MAEQAKLGPEPIKGFLFHDVSTPARDVDGEETGYNTYAGKLRVDGKSVEVFNVRGPIWLPIPIGEQVAAIYGEQTGRIRTPKGVKILTGMDLLSLNETKQRAESGVRQYLAKLAHSGGSVDAAIAQRVAFDFRGNMGRVKGPKVVEASSIDEVADQMESMSAEQRREALRNFLVTQAGRTVTK